MHRPEDLFPKAQGRQLLQHLYPLQDLRAVRLQSGDDHPLRLIESRSFPAGDQHPRQPAFHRPVAFFLRHCHQNCGGLPITILGEQARMEIQGKARITLQLRPQRSPGLPNRPQRQIIHDAAEPGEPILGSSLGVAHQRT